MYNTEIFTSVIYHYSDGGRQMLATPNVEIAIRRNKIGDIKVETITGTKSEWSTLALD